MQRWRQRLGSEALSQGTPKCQAPTELRKGPSQTLCRARGPAWPGQRSLSKSWPPEPREDKHCCRQLSSVWHFVTATTGNQHEDQMQSAHFAKCMTHRLRWPSVQSHLPRSRSFTREQTVVSGPATGHRASRLKPDHQGRFQSQPKCVRFYTFNMCHLLYFSRIVKKNNKKKDVQKGKNT